MKFADKLKSLMEEMDVSQARLSVLTGIGKSSISQYLSGKNVPTIKNLTKLAEVLDVSVDWFDGTTDKSNVFEYRNKLKVENAAKLMGVGKQMVRQGLKNGIFPFGYAVQMPSGKFTYYISPKKFTEYTGIEVPIN